MARITKKQIAQALTEAAGNVSAAARRLGVRRTSLHRRIADSEMLQRIVADEREALCDDAEKCIADAIRDGDAKTAQWYLMTSQAGRARGYGKTEAESGQADNHGIQAKIVEVVVSTREQVAELMQYEDFAAIRST